MFSKTKLKSGGTLQEVSRSGNHAMYKYVPKGAEYATHKVRASNERSAEGKLMMAGIIPFGDMFDDETDDVKPLTAGAKKPQNPYAHVKKGRK